MLEYLAYSEIEPPPLWQATGLLCAVMANCWSKKTYKPSDFVPALKEHKDPDSIDTWRQLFGGRCKQTANN